MSVLLDTNILLRYGNKGHPQNPVILRCVESLQSRGEAIHIVSQNLYEFWSVATRPIADNGLGLTVGNASLASDRLQLVFPLLPDHPALFSTWNSLVRQHNVIGKSAHDARLVAAMLANGINSILTFNTRDFLRYTGISVLDPNEIFKQAQTESE